MLLIPIHNIKLGKDAPQEIRIGNVTLITPIRLRRKWKQFKLPLSFKKIKEKLNGAQNVFEGNHLVFAQELEASDFKADNFYKHFDEINRLIYILSSSDLAIGAFHSRDTFGYINTENRHLDYGFSYSGNDYSAFNRLAGPSDVFHLDKFILSKRHFHFFNRVIPLFNSKLNLDKMWEADLKQAIILGGKAVCCKEHWESFNWCFIAIERLLKEKSRVTFLDQVRPRLKSLFGEFNHYSNDKWDKLIEDIYAKRNLIVHTGEFEKVSLQDAIIAESLLKNILFIILKNVHIFQSKSMLIDFAKTYEAKKYLGLKFKRRGNFHFGIPIVEDAEKRIRKNRLWY